MTEHYVQTVDVSEPKRGKIMLIAGSVLKLLSFGFILLGAFLSPYYLIGLVLMFGIGMLLTRQYNSSYRQYEYDCNGVRLVVCATNRVNKRQRVREICFCDVQDFAMLTDLIDEKDEIYCDDPKEQGTYALVEKKDGEYKRILISPDDYMRNLITERLSAERRDKESA